MKIQITKLEIAALLIQRYALPSDTEIEIVEATVSIPDFIQRAIIEVEKFSKTEVIPRIKALREYTSCGLADGKALVENWDNFKAYVSQFGKMPENAYSDKSWLKKI